MAFDSYTMRSVLTEYKREFPEAKIEKVLEPQRDEIDLVIKCGRNQRRLVFNVGPNAPRLQLSSIAKENPEKAPIFCMLLRKHLTGGRIISAEQLDGDRIAVFTVACYDDMGFPTTKKIICEIMGKYANFILTDDSFKVISALKIIDFAASTVRQVLPGLQYQQPKIQEKKNILELTRDEFATLFSTFPEGKSVEKFITTTFGGIATQIAHELTYRATGSIDVPLVDADADSLFSVIEDWQQLLINENYTPTLVEDSEGKPLDYSYMDITYLGDSAVKKSFDSFADLFDRYFAERDRIERIHQRAHDLINIISAAISRTERKLAIQRESLIESEKGEEYKKFGDLITANIYRLERGMSFFSTVDFYDESCPTVEIPLDTRLSPSANAQRMYKLYNKCKKAREVLTEQISIWERELVYLHSVDLFLRRAEREEDLVTIRDELFRSGYASRMKGYRPPKSVKTHPMKFTTSGGYTVLVGRNNTENDYLTFRLAEKRDIWFHTKDIPGSHVILVTEGREPESEDYTEAATLAAYYSSASGDLVAVDYTAVKNIKKPQGAKPGFVTYRTNYTAFVKRRSPKEMYGNG